MAKNKINQIFDVNSAIKDLDEPFKAPSGFDALFKKGKLRVIIIYEDGSYIEVFKKFNKSYFIEHKNKKYQVVPKCIIRGKYPTILYYYNNPAPLYPEFKVTSLRTSNIKQGSSNNTIITGDDITKVNTYIDAEALNSALDSTFLKGLYANKGLTTKTMIIIAVLVFVAILIILQLTGTVDVIGMLSGKVK